MVSGRVDNTETTIVDEKLLNDSKETSNGIKQQHLKKLKNQTYIIYTVVAILATATTSIYSYFSVKLASDMFSQRYKEVNKDEDEIFLLRWISSAVFTVVQSLMSLIMMCLLKT